MNTEKCANELGVLIKCNVFQKIYCAADVWECLTSQFCSKLINELAEGSGFIHNMCEF